MGVMIEPTEEQFALAEKLRLLDEHLHIRWSKEGVPFQIDGIIPISIYESIEESVRCFLKEYRKLFRMKQNLSDLKFIRKANGLGTIHIEYQQHHEDVPVFDAFTLIHLNREHNIIQIKNYYHPVIALDTKLILSQGISKGKAIETVHLLFFEKRIHEDCTCEAHLKIFPEDDEFYLTWEVCTLIKFPESCMHVYVNVEDGRILNKIDILKKKEGTGEVIIPNPVIALGNSNITLESEIPNEAYTSVILRELDGSGFLRGPYVDTGDTPHRTCEPLYVFNYRIGDSRFHEVMVYYHIDSVQRYIQNLGFKNVCNKQIRVNASAPGRYNSYYFPENKTISYGSAGIPDAEDADIIVHEYAHAIQDDQVPGFGMTDEGCAMGNGFGDFLAACYFSEENRGYNREAFGDWNGVGMVLNCVRRVDGNKHYPEDFLGVMRCDADGEIWSAVLWDVYLVLGGNSKKKEKRIKAQKRSIMLVIESHFYLTPVSQFRDGADAIMTANKILCRGRDEEKIRVMFIKRGILP